MNPNLKAILVSLVIFVLIFLGIRTLLTIYFNIENATILTLISVVGASILSPRRIIVKKQTGKEVLLKWVFSKKIIRF